MNTAALSESRYSCGTPIYALSPIAAAISFALRASINPRDSILSIITSAVALSSVVPIALTMCMIA